MQRQETSCLLIVENQYGGGDRAPLRDWGKGAELLVCPFSDSASTVKVFVLNDGGRLCGSSSGAGVKLSGRQDLPIASVIDGARQCATRYDLEPTTGATGPIYIVEETVEASEASIDDDRWQQRLRDAVQRGGLPFKRILRKDAKVCFEMMPGSSQAPKAILAKAGLQFRQGAVQTPSSSASCREAFGLRGG
ncbi:hypothetical protein GVN21_15845 [Caulobacter sp. SLTY]|uniref:hypothetical protein n=1 Tax=Caulobacter sp. SLTY TaxID=2683262 RepID=UPI001412DD97|nr:hypothetical protein [Caulobacter sp. SLTY]NBB16837.1 hypothetical protein [Caulobacter sp. SLTY]